jgi:hypothetical protein
MSRCLSYINILQKRTLTSAKKLNLTYINTKSCLMS